MKRTIKKIASVALAGAVAAGGLPIVSAFTAVKADALTGISDGGPRSHSPVIRQKGEILQKHQELIDLFYPAQGGSEADRPSLSLSVLNYYRWLAGLPELEDVKEDQVAFDTMDAWQYGVKTDHTAYNGVKLGGAVTNDNKCDLIMGDVETPSDRFSAIDIMRAVINDDTQEHNYRQAVLSRNTKECEVIFGTPLSVPGAKDYAGAISIKYVNNNEAKNNTHGNYGFYAGTPSAWPSAGYFPVEELDPQAKWSVGFDCQHNGYYDSADDLFVRITDMDTGEVYTRNTSSGLTVDTTCGVMLTFDPPTDDNYENKNYHVFVGGLKQPAWGNGRIALIQYEVHFMTYNDFAVADVPDETVSDHTYYAFEGLPFNFNININVFNASSPYEVKYYYKSSYLYGSEPWKFIASGTNSLNYDFKGFITESDGDDPGIDDPDYPGDPDGFFDSDLGPIVICSDEEGVGLNYVFMNGGNDYETYFYVPGTSSSYMDQDHYGSVIKAEVVTQSGETASVVCNFEIHKPVNAGADLNERYRLGEEYRIRTYGYAQLYGSTYTSDYNVPTDIKCYIKPADADDSAYVEYERQYFENNGYDDEYSIVFKPTETGKYTLKVTAGHMIQKCNGTKDEDGYFEYSDYKYMTDEFQQDFEVTDKTVENMSFLSSDAGYVKHWVYIYGRAQEGISPYTYTYYYKRANAKNWRQISESDITNTGTKARFKPAAVGEYQFKVTVTENGEAAFDDKILTYTVTDEMVNESYLSAYRVVPGTTVVFNGKATGGSGSYTYQYSYKRNNAKNWTNMGGDTHAYFKPKSVGEFQAKITVIDSAGNKEEKLMDLTVTDELVNQTTLNADRAIALGDRIIVNNAAAGGTPGYTFVNSYKKVGSKVWKNLGSSFKPVAKGVFEIESKVTDAKGDVQTVNYTVEVVDPVVNKSTLNGSEETKQTAAAGTRFTLAGAAEGGSGNYTYRYYYKRTTAKYWTTCPSATVKLKNAGSFQFKVVAVDASGLEVEKLFDVTVTA